MAMKQVAAGAEEGLAQPAEDQTPEEKDDEGRQLSALFAFLHEELRSIEETPFRLLS